MNYSMNQHEFSPATTLSINRIFKQRIQGQVVHSNNKLSKKLCRLKAEPLIAPEKTPLEWLELIELKYTHLWHYLPSVS